MYIVVQLSSQSSLKTPPLHQKVPCASLRSYSGLRQLLSHFYSFAFSRNFMEMESHNIKPFMSDFFHFPWCFWELSMLLNLLIVCSLLFCLWTFGLPFQFWLLWLKLLWTVSCKSYCGCRFSFLLTSYLGLELLAYMVTVCLTFKETVKVFYKLEILFYIPTSSVFSSSFSTTSSTLDLVCLSKRSHSNRSSRAF